MVPSVAVGQYLVRLTAVLPDSPIHIHARAHTSVCVVNGEKKIDCSQTPGTDLLW